MSAEDLERYEAEIELQLYQEYKDVLGMFQYAIETERRFYLANKFDLQVRNQDGDTYFDITLHDAWVWDMYRPARFVTRVRVVTFKDVNIEEFIRKEGIRWASTRHGATRDKETVDMGAARPVERKLGPSRATVGARFEDDPHFPSRPGGRRCPAAASTRIARLAATSASSRRSATPSL